MGKERKSTKHFMQRRLDGELVARRAFKADRKDSEMKASRRAAREKAAVAEEEDIASIQRDLQRFLTKAKAAKDKTFDGMDADAFLNSLGGSDDDMSSDFEDMGDESEGSDMDVLVQDAEGTTALAGKKSKKDAKKGKKGSVSSDDDDSEDDEQPDDEPMSDDDEDELLDEEDDLEAMEEDAEGDDFDSDDEAAVDASLGSGSGRTAVEGGVREIADEFSDDDEDEEDEEALDDEQVIARHRAELETLKETDPEFYKDLQESSKDILGFVDAEEAADAAHAADSSRQATLIERLTKEDYLALRESMSTTSFPLKSLVRTVRLFKSAILLQTTVDTKAAADKANIDDDEAASRKAKASRKLSPEQKVTVTPQVLAFLSSKLFNHFIQFALRTIPTALAVALSRDPAARKGASESVLAALASKKPLAEATAPLSDGPAPWAGTSVKQLPTWGSTEPLAHTYFVTLGQFLSRTVDSVTVRFTLRSLLPAIPLFEGVPSAAPRALKSFIRFWSHGADTLSNHDDSRKSAAQIAAGSHSGGSGGKKGPSSFGIDQATRIDAFLAIRRLCLTLPPRSQVLEATLKGLYLAYVRSSKNMNAHTQASVVFMCNCVAEIYGVDLYSSYYHACTYIKQLAIHLRAAIQKGTPEAIRSVYNWQFLNSLRAWSQVLSMHATDPKSPLGPLVYPFVQVCLGVIELAPSPSHFPVRFVIAEFLNTVSEKCSIYVPLAPHLLSVLGSSALVGGSSGSGTAAKKNKDRRESDLAFKLHLSPAMMDTDAFRSTTMTRVFDALTRHLAIYSHSIAFPELVLPIRFLLRRFSKTTRVAAASRSARQLLTAVGETSQSVLLRRAGVAFSPRDILSRGISGVDTLKHPQLLAQLNAEAVAMTGMGALADAAGQSHAALANAVRNANKETPLEALWAVRARAHVEGQRQDIVIGAVAAKRAREGESDDIASDEEVDADDLDDEEEEEEEVPSPKAKKAKKAEEPASKLTTAQRIAAAAKAAALAATTKGKQTKRSAPVDSDDSDDDGDDDSEDAEGEPEEGWGSDGEEEDAVEDFVLSDDEDAAESQKKRRLANKTRKTSIAVKRGAAEAKSKAKAKAKAGGKRPRK